jgi:hypothetical protein
MDTVEIYRAVVEERYVILGYIAKDLAPKIEAKGDIHEVERYTTWDFDHKVMLKIYSAMLPYGYIPKGITFYQEAIRNLGENATLAIAHIPNEHDVHAMAVICVHE